MSDNLSRELHALFESNDKPLPIEEIRLRTWGRRSAGVRPRRRMLVAAGTAALILAMVGGAGLLARSVFWDSPPDETAVVVTTIPETAVIPDPDFATSVSPTGSVFLLDGDALSYEARVVEVDLATGAVISVVAEQAGDAVMAPDGETIYVARSGGIGKHSTLDPLIEIASFDFRSDLGTSRSGVVDLQIGPSMAVSSDGARLYFVERMNAGEDGIHISVRTIRTVDMVELAGNADLDRGCNPAGILGVADPVEVAVLCADTREIVLMRIDGIGVGTEQVVIALEPLPEDQRDWQAGRLVGATVTPDGTGLYAIDGLGNLVVIDTTTKTVADRLSLSPDGSLYMTGALAISRDGKMLYAGIGPRTDIESGVAVRHAFAIRTLDLISGAVGGHDGHSYQSMYPGRAGLVTTADSGVASGDPGLAAALPIHPDPRLEITTNLESPFRIIGPVPDPGASASADNRGTPTQTMALPGVAVRVNGTIYDLSSGTPEPIAELPAGATTGYAVRTKFGLIALTPTPPWSDMWLLPADGSQPELLSQNVSGFAIHGDGERIAWSTVEGDCSDGTYAAWVEAELPSAGYVLHANEGFDGWDSVNEEFGGTNGCSSVAAYVGDVVVVQTGDGAASASGTWVPATGAVTFIDNYYKFHGGDINGGSIVVGDYPRFLATLRPDGTVVVPGESDISYVFDGSQGRANRFSIDGDRVLSIYEDYDTSPIENGVLVESYPSGDDLVRVLVPGAAMQIDWLDDDTAVVVLAVVDVDYVIFRCDLITEECTEAFRVRPEIEGFGVVSFVRSAFGS